MRRIVTKQMENFLVVKLPVSMKQQFWKLVRSNVNVNIDPSTPNVLPDNKPTPEHSVDVEVRDVQPHHVLPRKQTPLSTFRDSIAELIFPRDTVWPSLMNMRLKDHDAVPGKIYDLCANKHLR